MFRGPHCTSVM